MSDTIHYRVTVTGLTIKTCLMTHLSLSGRFIKRAEEEKRLLVNGKSVKASYPLQVGDQIEVIARREEQNIVPQDLDIEIVYEDGDMLIVNKPPFMLVHPTPNFPLGTLTNGVLYHFNKTNQNCIVRLVSRLDRDTSGLITIAKNAITHRLLQDAMNGNQILKTYQAIVHGHITPEEGTIHLPIGDDIENPIKKAVVEGGQTSITHYRTLKKFKEASLLELTLETGRTHQIRVHLSHLGHPIFGDSLYGQEEPEAILRQALHASQLIIPHPKTGEKMLFVCPLPEDMKKLLSSLE